MVLPDMKSSATASNLREADMKSCFRLLIPLLGLSLGITSQSGCRSHRGAQELLERELRWQEDEIFNLGDSLDEYKQRLDACRRENESLKRQLGQDYDLPSRSRSTLPSRSNQSTSPSISTPPSIELPGHDSSPGPRSPPLISPPGQLPESSAAPREELILPRPGSTSTGTMGEAPRFETAPLYQPHEGGTPAREVKSSTTSDDMTSTRDATSKEIERITLNKFLTGGHNADSQPGDDGVMVHIEPRNQRGELVDVPGEVSIVVLDPALQGAEARVARWDYTADETVTRYQKVGLAPGFHFEPRWPNRPPTSRTVDLHVRFTTLDGRRLEATKRIDLDAVVSEERAGGDHANAANGQWSQSSTAARATRMSEELAPRWPAEGIKTEPIPMPVSIPVESIARPIEPAPAPAKASAGKPTWSPYR
jgi:hypothetical protein